MESSRGFFPELLVEGSRGFFPELLVEGSRGFFPEHLVEGSRGFFPELLVSHLHKHLLVMIKMGGDYYGAEVHRYCVITSAPAHWY